jgi:hypothetical protein
MRAVTTRAALRTVQGRALLQLLVGVLLIAGMIIGPTVFGMVTESTRLDPSLAGVSRPANVAVTMDFEPQGFHMRTLQRYGVFGGKSSDRRVRLFQVPPDDLESLSHIYWVTSIKPAAGP